MAQQLAASLRLRLDASQRAQLTKRPTSNPTACAMDGNSGEAVKWLRESAATGLHLYPRYTRDALLNRIRQSPEFIQFLAEMRAENERYRREFPGR